MKARKKITIIGLGYVGLPLALLAAKNNYEVYGLIRSKRKAELINKGISPINDPYLIKKLKKQKIKATTDPKVIKNTDIVIICVPTPVDNNFDPDMQPLIDASTQVGMHLTKGQTIILESTVNPGMSEEVIIPILEKQSGLKVGKDFHYAHCPERINPGDQKWTVENINRVLGASDKVGLTVALNFYKSIIKAHIKPMQNIREAEAVKIVENSFRDINIAFVNELALSFSKLGIDLENVIEGASTKPFGFLTHYPGIGVGGHCIPVDPYYLIHYAGKNGFSHEFLSVARKVNNKMPDYAVNLLLNALKEKNLQNKSTQVTVLGIAYKSGIDDDRNSPTYQVVKALAESGIKVVKYDPYLLEKSDADSLETSLKGSSAVILVTGHKAFKDVTVKLLQEHNISIVIDGRNFFDKKSMLKANIYYRGIGR